MRLVYALVIAFSTYSKIPMPQIEWNDDRMRYSVCFFPLVGAVIGFIFWLWMWLCETFGFGLLLKGAVAAVIPIIISGGIHMDGFIDVMDARSSWQPKERKLEILKDPHVGAFAIIGCICYMLMFAGFASEATFSDAVLLAQAFILSRALSGYALVTLRGAKTSGLLNSFKSNAQKNSVKISMLVYVVACSAVCIYISPIQTLCGLLACGFCLIYYWKMSYKQFGGITGDLAGYFTHICELAFFAAVVMAGRFI